MAEKYADPSVFNMDSFRLDGKVALVTGASYGIGFALATAFAKAGAKIAFNDRNQNKIDQGLADYAKEGIEAKGYIADVTKEDEVAHLIEEIKRDFGTTPDILVNNAGIIKRIPMLEMSAADYRQVVDIDLTGPFIVSKAVLPGMIEKGHGKIINICSMMSELGRETIAGYAAATSAPSLASTTSSATASVRATSPRRRPPRCARSSRTAPCTRSTPSFAPRRRPRAGAHQSTSWVPRCSSPLTRATS